METDILCEYLTTILACVVAVLVPLQVHHFANRNNQRVTAPKTCTHKPIATQDFASSLDNTDVDASKISRMDDVFSNDGCSSFFTMLDCNSSDDEGEHCASPISIFEEVNGKLTLQKENLRKLLNPAALKDKKIAIVSIAGALRMGKSFLLNLLLKYLRTEGWNKKGEWLRDWDSSKDVGLAWRGGSEAHTRGIVAWGKPIIMKRFDCVDEEIAVILLDTQGNFEHGRPMEENVKVFALSTLFSSLQIFNVNKQIQTNDLEYLQAFVEFAKMMMSDQEGQSDVDSGVSLSYGNPFFQDLTYLVRDWSNPADYEYGNDGGMKYMKHFMSPQNGTESQSDVHVYLTKTFQNLKCFLMPEPGKNVRVHHKERKALTTADLEEEFAHCLVTFAENYLHPHKVPIKRIGHLQHPTAEHIIEYMEKCADALVNGNLKTDIPNLMHLIADYTKNIAMDRAEKAFIDNLTKDIDQMDEPTWDTFNAMVKREEEIAAKDFRNTTQYGSRDSQKNEEQLKRRFHAVTERLKARMHKMRKEYAKELSKTWLDESIETIKDNRGYLYTNPSQLENIKQNCVTLSFRKHDEDNQGVAEVVANAKTQFEALTNKTIEEEKNANWARARHGFMALGVTTAVATPFAALSYAVGSILLGALGGGTSLTGGGYYFKTKLDELWNKRVSKKTKID